MSDFPAKLRGDSPLVPWLNKLRDASAEGRITSFINGKFARGPGGTQLFAAPPSPVSGGGGASLKWCHIESIGQDHYSVKEWDGAAVTGSAFNVAKSTKLRGSITGETIDAVAITYDYTGFTTSYEQREADDGTNTEKQVVVPHWLEDDLIWAAQVTETGVQVSSVEVTWLDINIDARAWARKFDQT